MVCSRCGHDNEQSARFCEFCGTSLASMELGTDQPARVGRCPLCGEDLSPLDSFCASCGHPVGHGGTAPASTSQRPKVARGERLVSCTSCRALNPPGNRFCESCGAPLSGLDSTAPTSGKTASDGPSFVRTSGAWWLLPIFLTWVGGLIGWLAVRERDRKKARRLLLLGIVTTVLLTALALLVSIIPFLLDFYYW